MTHRMACCCGDGGGGGPSGCDLEALCVEVEFNGINIADFFAAWQAECGDPDCDDDLPAVLAAWGFNTVLRGNIGLAPLETCEARTVVRGPETAPCAVVPGQRTVYPGLIVAIETACVDDQLYATSITLSSNHPVCPVGSGEIGANLTYFRWNVAGDFSHAVPVTTGGSTVPNQMPTAMGDGPTPCEPYDGLVRGVGGFCTIRLSTAPGCVNPERYAVAERCDDDTVTISVDMGLAPAGHYGILLDDVPYRLTGRTTEEPPVAVTFTEEVCPTDPGKGPFDAVRCRDTGPAMIAPEHLTYFPAPGVPAGTGTVQIMIETRIPGGACDEIVCVYLIRYRPTLNPAIPGTQVGSHTASATCSLPDSGNCYEDGCPPGVEGRPVNICDQPDPPSWCNEAEGEGGGEAMAMQAEGGYSEEFVARQVAHLSTPLRRQARAANCLNCGDPGTEGLA